MRIAAHNGARIWGGAERGTSLILAGLQRRGHEVFLYCNDPLVARNAAALGVPVAIRPLGGDVAVWDAVRFAATLRRRRPDALLLGTFKKLWLGALAGRLGGVPRIVARIGLETDTPRTAKYRVVMRHWIDAIVLKADDVRSRYLDAMPDLDGRKLVTILGAVEPRSQSAAPGTVRAELAIAPQARVVGTIGRLAEQKRLDRFLQVVARLPVDVVAVVAGDGEEGERLRALTTQLGISDRVRFLGHRDDVGDVLAALDLFVVTSDREMLSFAMLEALAAGVPVVSTPVSGAAEALAPFPDGRSPGVAVGSFEVEAIAAEVEALLAEPARLAEMGVAARERAERAFGFERMLDEWERVLAGSEGGIVPVSRPAAGRRA